MSQQEIILKLNIIKRLGGSSAGRPWVQSPVLPERRKERNRNKSRRSRRREGGGGAAAAAEAENDEEEAEAEEDDDNDNDGEEKEEEETAAAAGEGEEGLKTILEFNISKLDHFAQPSQYESASLMKLGSI